MRFDSVLKSNHELKKNGYKIIRKLHKLETYKGVERAYADTIDDTYYFIIGCRALVDIIKSEYPDADQFSQKCDAFLGHLDSIALNKGKINKNVLSSFLRSYTKFFNNVIKQKKKFSFDQKIVELWNIRCLMPYIATWGKNH